MLRPPPVDLARLRALPYVRPKESRDYWVLDDALPDPAAVTARSLARTDFDLGFPHRPEHWPGMRATGGLTREELAPLERWVRLQTKTKSLFQPDAAEGTRLDHNTVQIVGATESGPRPHTDSRKLCRYAAVLYLCPTPESGRGDDVLAAPVSGRVLGGNTVEAPSSTLADALGVRALPFEGWLPEVAVENVYNRLLLYRANLVHSATRYFGSELADKRMTAVFFWMTRP